MFKRRSKRGKSKEGVELDATRQPRSPYTSSEDGGIIIQSSVTNCTVSFRDVKTTPSIQRSHDSKSGTTNDGGTRSSSRVSESKSESSKRVTFQHVQVREFERIIGDNPSCSTGAPIALGWAHGRDRTMRIDDYESVRPRRRHQMELILNRQEREGILLEWGASFQQIIDSIRANIRVKNQRRRTVGNSDRYDRWEEAMENAGRKIKRRLLLKKSTRQRAEELSAQLGITASTHQQATPDALAGDDEVGHNPTESPTHSERNAKHRNSSTDDVSPERLTSDNHPIITEPDESNRHEEFGFLETEPDAPLPEINVVGKATISEEFYSYMEEMTVNSGLTATSGLTHEAASYSASSDMSDTFEMLVRDCSFWHVAEGGVDFPCIRRRGEPMVISEDVGPGALSQFDFWDSNGGYGPSAPPRLPSRQPIPFNSHTMISTME